MRFDELSWFDIDEYLKYDNRLILVLGSCEQHAYLSLLTDVKIPMAIADAASEKTGVLVAPPLNFGCSPYFMAYPGTISLRSSTFLDIVEDIIGSIYRNGFRRILVLNGHGGNDLARSRLYEMLNSLPELQISWYAWWQSHSLQEIARKYDLKPAHANWLESFGFTRVQDLPGNPKAPAFIPGLLNSDQARKVYGDGSFGGEYLVNSIIMDEVFSAVLDDVIHLLQFTN